MKILHVLSELKYSGAEIMYVDAAHVFQEMDCELFVLATAKSLGEFAPQFKKAGYSVFHKALPKRVSMESLFYIKDLVKFIRQERIDVVHNHSNQIFGLIAFCSKLAGVKCVYTFHNVFQTHWYSSWYHIVIRWVSKVIFGCKFQTISDSVYTNELITFKNKTKKINNWYAAKRFYPAEIGEKDKIREELNIDKNSLVIISIGGCSHVKRHEHIIEALPKLLKKTPNLIYLHLGEGNSTVSEISLADELGIGEKIRFYGNKIDVRKYLIASDLYLMTSKYEGISITTIEAMACGIPAILYNVPGLKDFNVNDENSLLIDANKEALIKAVLVLYKDSQKSIELSFKAKEFVNKKYNIDINAKQIYQLYF